jgi:hypothetical protein
LRREDGSQEEKNGYRSQDYSYQFVHRAMSLCLLEPDEICALPSVLTGPRSTAPCSGPFSTWAAFRRAPSAL